MKVAVDFGVLGGPCTGRAAAKQGKNLKTSAQKYKLTGKVGGCHWDTEGILL